MLACVQSYPGLHADVGSQVRHAQAPEARHSHSQVTCASTLLIKYNKIIADNTSGLVSFHIHQFLH